ncbi:Phosphotransferase enzyme family protein [Nakamurella panacisegetis]|uniref:Phosphotransferase enzyme family protein n=2 Tax=Nakamurella panacisegetis TaxID=1090615 RepID=A0A1H0KZ89_9ACTN|nr:Phosphotransferase enzyme family protein [Nakamurella panacisegetis]
MDGEYRGYVSGHDPMFEFLRRVLAERLGVTHPHPAFRVFALTGSAEVYRYEEKSTGTQVICKFYGNKYGWDRDRAAALVRQEYQSLRTLRGYGLAGSPHHVVRPLALDVDINCVLAMEYYRGEPLSRAISRGIGHGEHDHLYWRLTALAYFLATQHRRTANGIGVDFQVDASYLRHVVRRSQRAGRMGQGDADEFNWLSDQWRDRSVMWQDQEVWLHGDATPANFLFGSGLDAAAVDLERMRRGDRMFDVGRVAGELQHASMSMTGDRHRAEPFIGHFLWEYSCHFPDREGTFASITRRLPYYMGLNLLRIAANDYVGDDYRHRLLRQGKELLRAH